MTNGICDRQDIQSIPYLETGLALEKMGLSGRNPNDLASFRYQVDTKATENRDSRK